MQIQIIRHGTASHLLEDYNRKLTYTEFVDLLYNWIPSPLTSVGKEEILSRAEDIKTAEYYHIYYSPLKRTKQSAKPFFRNPNVINTHEMQALEEIIIHPPFVPKFIKLSIRFWIILCIIKSIFNLSLIRYLGKAKTILREIESTSASLNSLIISHQARIITILIYCFFSTKWKITEINIKPAGLSIIKSK